MKNIGDYVDKVLCGIAKHDWSLLPPKADHCNRKVRVCLRCGSREFFETDAFHTTPEGVDWIRLRPSETVGQGRSSWAARQLDSMDDDLIDPEFELTRAYILRWNRLVKIENDPGHIKKMIPMCALEPHEFVLGRCLWCGKDPQAVRRGS
jgi:hypothetical protein